MNNKNALVSRLGPVMQLAYVPSNLNAAMAYWTDTMGVGPFYEMSHLQLEKAMYRGAEIDLDISVWIAYWGDIQVELVQQHNDVPSIYKTWLDAGSEGLHHVCIVVDDIQHARAVCQKAGARTEQEIWVHGAEAIYVDAGGGQGGLIEIIQMPGPDLEFFEYMKAQARDWDGSRPIRIPGED